MSVLSLRNRCDAAEAAGRGAARSPLLTDVLAAELSAALAAPPPDAHTALVWAAITSGDPNDAGVEASATGRTWNLTGRVLVSQPPAELRWLLVVARSRPIGGRDRGLRVHRISAAARGLQLIPTTLVDGSPMYTALLDGVEATDNDSVGPPRDATPVLTEVFDTARLLAAAEMLGAARAALDVAIEWTAQRELFGAPLDTRQVVQHRIADMSLACTVVRALVDDAITRTETGESFATEAAVAKLVASRRLPDVTAAAHQLHGGEGYYADRPLHGWHKRVLVLASLFGGPVAQRRHLAALLRPDHPLG